MPDDKGTPEAKEQGTPETITGPNISTPPEPGPIGYGWPKIDDPDGPVGYIFGPTSYIYNHEANQVASDGTVRRKKS